MNAEKIIEKLKYYHHAYMGEDNGLVPVSVLKDAIDLIHRLQDENEELKSPKFASWKIKFFNLKAELDKEIAEHEEFTKKVKAEIERLKNERIDLIGRNAGLCSSNNRLKERISKYKMQVDELKEERENMQAEIMRFEDMKFTQEHCDLYKENKWLKECLQQSVKDTAKEILQAVLEDVVEFYAGDIVEQLSKRYSVEVE